MRPQAIVHFEILYSISIVLSLLVTVLTWDQDADGLGVEAGIAGELLGALIYVGLMLWASQKGSNIARWIITVIFVIGFIFIVQSIPEIQEMGPIIAFTLPVHIVIQFAAIMFLFSSDAQPWFHKP